MYVCMRMSTCICVCMRMSTCICVCMRAYVCMDSWIHVDMYASTHLCMYACVYVLVDGK